MKILDARVDWMSDYDNHPNLKILIDKEPNHEDLIYDEIKGIHYSIKDGYASYLYYISPGEGYGGSVFNLRMSNGQMKALKGPWSSRAGCVNSIVSAAKPNFEFIVDVTMTDNPGLFKGTDRFAGCYYAGAITLSLAKQAAKIAKCHLVCEKYNGDITYYPSLSEHFVVKPRKRNKSKPTYKRFIMNESFEYKTLAQAKSPIPTKIIGGYIVTPSNTTTQSGIAMSSEQANITSIYPNSRYNAKGELFFMADNGKLFTPSQAAVLAYAFGQIPNEKEKLELGDIKK